MWKILTAQIRVEIYDSLISWDLSPQEQKRCCMGTRGTGELLYIDQHTLNESKARQKNLAMSWIDNKERNKKLLQMYKISNEIIRFTEKTIETWRVELSAEGKGLAEVKIPGGIFQGDARALLLFVIATMLLNHILKKYTANHRKRSIT